MKLVQSGTSRPRKKFAFNTVLSIPRKFNCTHKFGFDAPSHITPYLVSATHNSHVTSSSQYI